MKTKNNFRRLLMTALLATLAWLPSARAQQPCQAAFVYTVTNPNPSTYVVNFYDTSYAVGTITNWQWSLGNGTAAQGPNPVVTYTSPGNYLVCLTITSVYQNQTCTDTWCDTLVVPGNPPGCQAYFYAYPDSTNNNVYFNNQSQASSAATYYWTFGDGSTSTQMNPTHTYAANGWYQVCLTVIDSSAGCSDTYCDSVYSGNIMPLCSASFGIAINGTTVTLTNTSTGNYTSLLWNFGDNTTSTSPNPVHTYAAPGTYQICLTIWNNATGCQDTYCFNVTVSGGSSNCQAWFTYTANPSGGTSFIDMSTGNPSVYVWNFGDGSSGTGPNPVHTYANTGWYLVCLTISTPGTTCQSTWCDSVYVGNSVTCIADFGWNSTGGNNIAFNNNSTSGGVSPYYYWDFGDGSTSWAANPTHNYASSGTYQVCLMLIDSTINCWDTYCTAVTVQGGGSGCSSNFALYPDSLVAHTYWAYNLATGTGPLTYLWSWGDSTTSTGAYPSHTYAGPGLYTICLTITDATGCSSTTCYQWQLLRLSSSAPVTVNVIAGSTGINDPAEQVSLNVYPNPAAGQMTVELTNQTGSKAALELFNMEGRKVADFGSVDGPAINLPVDLRGIPAGMYFLRVSAGSAQQHLKVVVK